MSISLHFPRELRDRLLLVAMTPLAGASAAGLQLDAVANRFVNKVGVDGVEFRLSNLIDTVLKPAAGAGKVEINNLIIAIVALVMLGALVYFLFGILRTLGGRRGGIEAVGQVVFALIIGIAGLEVLLVTRAPAASLLAAALAAASACAAPSAIINKQLAARGHRTFATPADMASALFNGSSKVQTAVQVIAAIVLLGAAAATLVGVWQTLRGERGGLELAASGIFGVVGLMAALTVVM